jgi:hypothetical protein
MLLCSLFYNINRIESKVLIQLEGIIFSVLKSFKWVVVVSYEQRRYTENAAESDRTTRPGRSKSSFGLLPQLFSPGRL